MGWPRCSVRRRSALPCALLLTALLPSVVACGAEFDPPSKLNKPRILAVRATPPEVRPGQEVTLDALLWHPPNEGEIAASPGYHWRACFLTSDLGAALVMDAQGDATTAYSCFDLKQSVTLAELFGGAAPEGEALDLTTTAIDLGVAPEARLVLPPLPPFPGFPSRCAGLSDEARVEQGGRELWISGLRVMVSLRVEAGGQVITANKRLLYRPAAEAIPVAEQGQPFRTPRLCEDPAAAARLCAPNANPLPPTITTPNGEWSGVGPITVSAGEKIKLRPAPPIGEADRQPFVALIECGQQLTRPEFQTSGGEHERLESRYYAWYADRGELDLFESQLTTRDGEQDNAWTAPDDSDTAEKTSLYLVQRDDRGGVSWEVFELRVDP